MNVKNRISRGDSVFFFGPDSEIIVGVYLRTICYVHIVKVNNKNYHVFSDEIVKVVPDVKHGKLVC